MSAAVNNGRSSREILEDAIEELTTENVVLESMESESWPGIELERQKVRDKIMRLRDKIRRITLEMRRPNNGVSIFFLFFFLLLFLNPHKLLP